MRRAGAVAMLVVATAAATAPAEAQEAARSCGALDAETQRATRGTLELSPDSRVGWQFKRDTGTSELTLFYAIKGCEPPSTTDGVSVVRRPQADEDVSDIPGAALGLQPGAGPEQRPTIELDGSGPTLTITLHVTTDADGFDPGTYASQLEVRAPWLVTSRTPILLSRSVPNSRAWIIALLGGAAGLVGVFWYALSAAAANRRSSLTIGGPMLAVWAVLAGAAVGAASALLAWAQQDVFEWEAANILATFGAALLAASAGATGVLLRSVFGAVDTDAQAAAKAAKAKAATTKRPPPAKPPASGKRFGRTGEITPPAGSPAGAPPVKTPPSDA